MKCLLNNDHSGFKITIFKHHLEETYQTIKPIVKWAMKNSDQFLITFFQMMFKNSDFETAMVVV